MLHRLRDEQLLLMKDFMGCFVKPELLLNVSGKKICEIDLEADASVKEEGHVHWSSGTAFTERMPQIDCRRSNSLIM